MTLPTAGKQEANICDIVGKIEQYGSPSDRQLAFLRALVSQIATREEREAKFAAERALAADIPEGRCKNVQCTVLKVERKHYDFDDVGRLVMTVKADAGWVVWGSVPANLVGVEKGGKIERTATLTRSDRDSKFGFFKRPIGRVVS